MATASAGQTAIVAITRRGVELGRRLNALLPESQLYVPQNFATGAPNELPFSLPAAGLVEGIFGSYRRLVLIMAVGIAVRLVAGKVSDKRQDPGLLVLDDCGRFAVSLLSGHGGGANDLAREVASLIGAQPVVTTASEGRGRISPDVLAKSFGWQIEDGSALTRVTAALVNDEPVGVYQDAGETGWSAEDLSPDAHVFPSIKSLRESGCAGAIVISDHLLDTGAMPMPTAIFRPRSLVVGIGCNRGVACEDIEQAVDRVFSANGLSTACIRGLATIDVKKDEAGLLQFAEKKGLPVQYFSRESLRKAVFPSPPSPVTLKHVGVPAVCEAAAVLGGGSIIVPKTSFNRRVTVAVARLPFEEDKRQGRLFLVGIGPGDPDQMTVRARQTLAHSDAVVGYKTYIDQVKPLLSGKEVVATGMGREVERVNRAIELAGQGKVVSLVSGGDSGVYGLAGLVGEVLQARDVKVDVEVVAGVPSVVAAGALLGAPLNVDVASVSLSDYLVAWDDIVRRLDRAAEADFVIALYNPQSKRRRRQLAEAREIILRHRAASTPVGIVSNASRPEQSVIITDLAHLLEHEIDMNTIVIIGNSTTFVSGKWLVTPRGYGNKYELG